MEELLRDYDARVRTLRCRLIAGDDVSPLEVAEIEHLFRPLEGQREFCLFLEERGLDRWLEIDPQRNDLATRRDVVRALIADRYEWYPAVASLLPAVCPEGDGREQWVNRDSKAWRIMMTYRAHCISDSLEQFSPAEELQLIEVLLTRLEHEPTRERLGDRSVEIGNGQSDARAVDAANALADSNHEITALTTELTELREALGERDASLQAAAEEVEMLRNELAQTTLRAAECAAALTSVQAELAAVNDQFGATRRALANRTAAAQRATAEVGELVIELAAERQRSAAAEAEANRLRTAAAASASKD